MAVTFDAVGPSSAGQTASAPTSMTWSHTCSGSERVLLVGVGVGDVTSDATKTISGVTYASVSMTSLGVRHSNDSPNGYVQVFALKAPAAGTASVVVTFASAPTSAEAGSVSFNGADQTTAWNTPVTAAGNNALATATLGASTTGNLVAYFVCGGSSFATSPTSPATSRYLANLNAFSAGGNAAGATTASTGSSVTGSWPLTTTDWWAELIVEIRASTGSAFTVDVTDDADLTDTVSGIPGPSGWIYSAAVEVG